MAAIRSSGDAAMLVPLLDPALARSLPIHDDWCGIFEVVSRPETYRIVNRGRGREPDGPEIHVAADGGTTDYRADMILEDGRFVKFPDGAQR